MPPRVEAIVEPELLVWAREKAGYEIDAAARKAHVSPDRLAEWERAERRPSVRQLRTLARVYRRPISVFYLSEPPRDFPPIRDFRVAWADARQPPSPNLLGEIESAHERREVALELLEDQGELAPSFQLRASIGDDPEALGDRFRSALGVEVDAQSRWADARTGFNTWRATIEARGVLVLQVTGVDQREARGFSIAERPLPVVVANNRDPYVARSFTLLHELTHVAIHEGGICDLSNRGRIEPFCNHVAGATLVPRRALLRDEVVRDHSPDAVEWGDDDLQELAETYRVSREVVLRRLLILGKTNEAFYRRKRRQLLDDFERREEDADEPRWGPSPSTTAVIRSGYYFSRLVLSSYAEGAITASDVSRYLGVRMKHVPGIEQMVFRHPSV
jgi:Zn-dependent peptidase ImmA (M78 family)